jgi:hypothetical protein
MKDPTHFIELYATKDKYKSAYTDTAECKSAGLMNISLLDSQIDYTNNKCKTISTIVIFKIKAKSDV